MHVRRLQLAAIPLLDFDHVAKERVSFSSPSLTSRSRNEFLTVGRRHVVGSTETLQGEARPCA
jgi:hypothetical protein